MNLYCGTKLRRSLWILCCHCLTNQKIGVEGSRSFPVDEEILLALFQELHRRALEASVAEESANPAGRDRDILTSYPAFFLYDSLSLALLCRLFQRKDLRSVLPLLIPRLPSLPLCFVDLLREIMLTGGTVVSKHNGLDSVKETDKSLRLLAMSLLSLFSRDYVLDGSIIEINRRKVVQQLALRVMLEATVSEDFWTRSSAVGYIVKYVCTFPRGMLMLYLILYLLL